MKWHESKFWRSVAIAGIALLAALILKLDTMAQDNDGTPNEPRIPTVIGGPTMTERAPAGRARATAGRAGDRLAALQAGGLIPWDPTRGLFLTVSDSADRIVLWDIGSDWETSINFKVNNSTVFNAGGR